MGRKGYFASLTMPKSQVLDVKGDGNAGLFGVGLGKCLPCAVCFRLEVQEIDRAFVAALAAGEQADGEDQHEGQSDDLFHDVASQLIFR